MSYYTLHLIEDKGKDSKWSIIGHGPIVYLTCSKHWAEFILQSMNKEFHGKYPDYP